MFRRHQHHFHQICQEIRDGHRSNGQNARSIICSITPGGGKSLLPLIAAHNLIGPVADRLCWVVPRRSLQQQAEAEFLKMHARRLIGHDHAIRRSTNEADPCRGLSGLATTYQAIGSGNAHLIREFRQHRYILVLDEPHHVEEGGAWEAALAPLVERAAITVFMSGTLERGNAKRIAFLPYRRVKEYEVVDLGEDSGAKTIRYSRREALEEKAILPIHFELMDGTADWIGRDGETYSRTLSSAAKDTAEALYTALKTQFAQHLLDACTAHWENYRLTHPRSKLLVVTANIEEAKKYVEHLKAKGLRAAIATSDDSAKAAANIEKYKTVDRAGSLDALVTVAMAYEGLDVPPITHLACLTHIRSKPWIEQMLARATRFDADAGDWESQMAFVYVPDDRNICAIIEEMQSEQIGVVKTRGADEIDWDVQPPERNAPDERNTITPVGSQAGERRWSQIGNLFDQNTLPGMAAPKPAAPPTAVPVNVAPMKTPSQLEAEARDAIQEYCKQVDIVHFDAKWGAANREVARVFQRPRALMTLAQLEQVREWLEGKFPLGPVRPNNSARSRSTAPSGSTPAPEAPTHKLVAWRSQD